MPVNILYLSPSNRWLGARISLFVLLKKLDQKRFHPIIVCPSKDGPFARILEESGFHVEYLRLWNWRKYKYVFLRMVSVWKLRNIIKKHKIDLIHCNEFWTAPYAFWATRGIPIPLISHVRLSMTPKKIKDYYLGHLTKIICVCKALVEEFSAWHDYKQRVVPIYNGVDLQSFDPRNTFETSLRSEFSIPAECIVIGLVGQISKRKGQDLLIGIAPRLIKHNPNIRFLIVGSSREPDYVKQINDMIDNLQLKNYFIFTGDREDMPRVYQAIDILILPSQREGFGRVVAEAEALEIPVVVSDAGGLVEVVEHGRTGFIFNLGNDQEMFDYLKKLCDDKNLRIKMGKEGRKLVEECFSQEIMVKKITGVYEEVLKHGKRD
ncbi:glycosyltransferase family 4 protein [Candidatus Sumerlaeota bacterium]|nr:glycosyltransferase family 4 protein [Candidatus Sumerlaeota bacterium]